MSTYKKSCLLGSYPVNQYQVHSLLQLCTRSSANSVKCQKDFKKDLANQRKSAYVHVICCLFNFLTLNVVVSLSLIFFLIYFLNGVLCLEYRLKKFKSTEPNLNLAFPNWHRKQSNYNQPRLTKQNMWPSRVPLTKYRF